MQYMIYHVHIRISKSKSDPLSDLLMEVLKHFQNKGPMGHIAHLRKTVQINKYI